MAVDARFIVPGSSNGERVFSAITMTISIGITQVAPKPPAVDAAGHIFTPRGDYATR